MVAMCGPELLMWMEHRLNTMMLFLFHFEIFPMMMAHALNISEMFHSYIILFILRLYYYYMTTVRTVLVSTL